MKLVLLGDSFTRGFGVKHNENWSACLNITGVEIINQGINGDTTSGMLARFYNDVIYHSPNYVLITGGTNDFISGSNCEIAQNNYMAMVHQAFHNRVIPIVGIEPGFMSEMIRSDWARFSDFKTVYKKQLHLREWLISMCHTFGIFYIDFYDAFKAATNGMDANELYTDGLHLTAKGHSIICKIVAASLNDILK